MTKIRFFLSTLLLCIFFSLPAFAQKYKSAAGVRFDNGFNLTAQQYITNGWTVEGILHTPLLASKDLGVTFLGENTTRLSPEALIFTLVRACTTTGNKTRYGNLPKFMIM